MDRRLLAAGGAAAVFGLGYVLGRRSGSCDDDGDDDDGCDDPLERLVRPNIRSLETYRCARDDYDEGILLDANENAFGSVLRGGDSSLGRATDVLEMNRYPCPYQWPLKELVAAFRGVRKENVFVGVGSDEAIDLLFRVFCQPRKSTVLITPPTYGMYKVCAAAQDVRVLSAPLAAESFAVVEESVLAQVLPSTRLLFICSPGNPTATSVPLAIVERLLQHEKLARCIVVVDEAYVDFSASERSAAPLVAKYERLVVLHTLSKAFGLAGARVGTAIASEKIVKHLNAVKAPYSINKMTSKLAQDALGAQGLKALHKTVAETLVERATLATALENLPFVHTVFKSDANFLLFRLRQHEMAKPLYTALADAGVVIRFRGDQPNCSGCLRVTVGTPEHNKAFLERFVETAKTFGLRV